MPDDYVPQPDPPTGAAPTLFRPSTFDRHARAVEIVEGGNNARYPRAPRGRTTHSAPGAWGYLASGATITAADGLTLGQGTVRLCSRNGTTLTDDGDFVTVYSSGSEIDGPLILELDWVGGDWTVCTCGAVFTPTVCVPCRPAGIVKSDITMNWESPDCTDTSGSATLTYTPGMTTQLDKWLGVLPANAGCNGEGDIQVDCISGTIKVQIFFPRGSDPSTRDSECDFTTPDAITCSSPWSAEWTSPGGGSGFPCTTFHGGSFSLDWHSLALTYEGVTTCNACYAIIRGCNSLFLGGASVQLWTDSSETTLIQSATSDSSGIAYLPTDATYTSGWLVVTKGRFITHTGTISLGCGTVVNVTLLHDASHHCLAGCADPAQEELHATFANAGARVFAWNGTAWESTFSYLGVAYDIVLGTDRSMVVNQDGAPCDGPLWSIITCPPALTSNLQDGDSGCLSDTGDAVLTE